MKESWRETCDRMRLDLSDDPKHLMRKQRNQIRYEDRQPNCTLPSFLVAAGLGVAGILLARQGQKLQDDGPLQRLGAAIDGLIAKIVPSKSVSRSESKDWRRLRPSDMAARAAYERAADQTKQHASTGTGTAKKKNKKKNKKKGKKR